MSTAVHSPKPENLSLFNLPPGSKATETELALPAKLKFEKWEEVTDGLIKAESSSQWLIGDALLYGRDKFGEAFAQVIDVQKLKRTDEATIRGYLWVSEKVKPVLRRTNLRWYHHKEVAKLEPEIQDKWLGLAETNGWTVRELRANIRSVEEDAEGDDETPELLVLQEPTVRQFLEDYKSVLGTARNSAPNVASILNMIDAHLGHAQWQLDRTDKEESVVILEAIDEGWQCGQEIFNWMQKRSYFMREPELQTRLAWMCENKKLREVKQGGRKDNQRGDLTSMYVRYDARTGEAFMASRSNSIYAMGDDA